MTGDPHALALHKPPLRRDDVESQVASVHERSPAQPRALSLVVVAYCETDPLLSLLAELGRQVALVDAPVDLVVVDNGLAEDVRQQARARADRHVVARRNVGCSHARPQPRSVSVWRREPFVAAGGFEASLNCDLERIGNGWVSGHSRPG